MSQRHEVVRRGKVRMLGPADNAVSQVVITIMVTILLAACIYWASYSLRPQLWAPVTLSVTLSFLWFTRDARKRARNRRLDEGEHRFLH